MLGLDICLGVGLALIQTLTLAAMILAMTRRRKARTWIWVVAHYGGFGLLAVLGARHIARSDAAPTVFLVAYTVSLFMCVAVVLWLRSIKRVNRSELIE